MEQLRQIIEAAWENRELIKEPVTAEAIREVVRLVDAGELRTAEPVDLEKSLWQVNEWVKK
ncbi:MAG: 2,3,4,5-tetrahydropyridine-2,6-dicarboxylate N-succinyltransferase, partial [Alistipes sp.]|nr:2,3,4,5-tetrahydropyridine-2,6-dicarboxylate N-succinyltransferase [Alistipes sp.]